MLKHTRKHVLFATAGESAARKSKKTKLFLNIFGVQGQLSPASRAQPAKPAKSAHPSTSSGAACVVWSSFFLPTPSLLPPPSALRPSFPSALLTAPSSLSSLLLPSPFPPSPFYFLLSPSFLLILAFSLSPFSSSSSSPPPRPPSSVHACGSAHVRCACGARMWRGMWGTPCGERMWDAINFEHNSF